VRVPSFWSLYCTVNAPHEAGTHVTALHADVVKPELAVHVAVPDPEYPSSHFTATLCVVVPVRVPSFWSLNDTVNAPHEAGTHTTVLHVDVVKPELAVHVAVPDPEYPSSHFTATVCVVVPEAEPAFWSLNGTASAPQDAGTHTTLLHADVTLPTSGVQIDTLEPEYPSSHCTQMLCVVKPLRDPAFWSLKGTVSAPQEAGTHVTTLHVDVVLPASAVHTDEVEPEYPSLHLTKRLAPVAPELVPV